MRVVDAQRDDFSASSSTSYGAGRTHDPDLNAGRRAGNLEATDIEVCATGGVARVPDARLRGSRAGSGAATHFALGAGDIAQLVTEIPQRPDHRSVL